ncbi:L-alanine dehydrogenase [Fodinibius salinus]|uniref:alanine dehydrogenase n=1 Tax=Fodinibius salinus TaxID=860790 RepID=A0A5D3YGV4_9BACT|nr:alanine dehydrogenase [Fodinibius salinus]TYP92554.1 L-alanine dehydrogenase [Fodinibius salinus]
MGFNPFETEKIGMQTLEKRLMKSNSNISLKIGLPKEVSDDERRICLTPDGVSVLTANDHEVFIEQEAGKEANFSDNEYADAGADLAYSIDEVYNKSDIILKVAPPTTEELEMLDDQQTLISAVHLGDTTEEFIQTLINKNITAIGFEFIKDENQEFPLVRMMHEITGSMAVQIGAHYLEIADGGQGIMLGGISGIPPATVLILGGEITAEYAARTALGYGAQVFVLDNDLARLRHLENALDRRITTATASYQYLSTALNHADVLIGASMEEGERAPCLVTEEMVANMKAGSVIVDTVIDQGGCISTSKPTTHSNPVFKEHDIIHYCVPNIPSNVARTATYALNNVIVPYLLAIGDAGGIKKSLWSNTALRNGTYVYKNHLTKKSLSKIFDISFREIEMLIASRI